MKLGLTSVTFRSMTPASIVEAVRAAGLDGIEWGADRHVPPMDLDHARQVRDLTGTAGLTTTSYGSYYSLGSSPAEDFSPLLKTAQLLGAPIIRVWAGKQGSAQTPSDLRQRIVADGLRVARLAADQGITVATEWHAGTITDTAPSAVDLLQAVDQPNFRTYWQPRNNSEPAEEIAGLRACLPWLIGLHVLHWTGEPPQRRPLAQGAAPWRQYFSEAAAAPIQFALLEFVRDDRVQQMTEDAATLRTLVQG